jgi:hypothetical protein
MVNQTALKVTSNPEYFSPASVPQYSQHSLKI